LAGRVPLKIVYVLTCRTLGLVVVLFRGDRATVAEVLLLRHENAVLRRQVGRVRYEPADRAWFAALARIVARRRWSEVFPVTPATLLAWHRRLATKKYDTSERRRPGRPPVTPGIKRLVLLWVPRISSWLRPAELLSLPPGRDDRRSCACGRFSPGHAGGLLAAAVSARGSVEDR
jgi:putative transposase